MGTFIPDWKEGVWVAYVCHKVKFLTVGTAQGSYRMGSPFTSFKNSVPHACACVFLSIHTSTSPSTVMGFSLPWKSCRNWRVVNLLLPLSQDGRRGLI